MPRWFPGSSIFSANSPLVNQRRENSTISNLFLSSATPADPSLPQSKASGTSYNYFAPANTLLSDVDDELGKIFNLKRRKYPITIVSDNTELYSGAFVLSRLVRFSAYYSRKFILPRNSLICFSEVPPKVNELLTSIRKSNSSFVPSFDQYEFVYRLLAHSLQKFRLI